MAYPFEMHFHTDEVSPCGNVPAAEAAAAYRREGYAGVVVTDHYAAYNFARFPGDWDTKVDAYLAGYRAAGRKRPGSRPWTPCGIPSTNTWSTA